MSVTRDGSAFLACGTEAQTNTSIPAVYWQHIATGERRVGSDRPAGQVCIEDASRSGRYVGLRDNNGAKEMQDFRYRSLIPAPFTGDVAFSEGDQLIAFESALALSPQDTNGHFDIYVQPAAAFFNRDADTLDDGWERAVGLSATVATGLAGPSGNPDGDGLSNAEELARGSHPLGGSFRYLAEGATGAFETRIALANRSGVENATAVVRFDKRDGTSVAQLVPVSARGRSSVIVGAAGLGTTDFATVVESDVPLVVDRLMTWDATRYGSHAETSAGAPATQWFLAEGSTVLGFQLFYLLQNPQTPVATATVRYLLPSGAPIVHTYASRRTAARRSTSTTNPRLDVDRRVGRDHLDAPIVVERSMYRPPARPALRARSCCGGVTAAATSWFLAEGATGTFFDTYVLVANPSCGGDGPAIDVRLDGDGRRHATYTVGAERRFTVYAD